MITKWGARSGRGQRGSCGPGDGCYMPPWVSVGAGVGVGVAVAGAVGGGGGGGVSWPEAEAEADGVAVALAAADGSTPPGSVPMASGLKLAAVATPFASRVSLTGFGAFSSLPQPRLS